MRISKLQQRHEDIRRIRESNRERVEERNNHSLLKDVAPFALAIGVVAGGSMAYKMGSKALLKMGIKHSPKVLGGLVDRTITSVTRRAVRYDAHLSKTAIRAGREAISNDLRAGVGLAVKSAATTSGELGQLNISIHSVIGQHFRESGGKIGGLLKRLDKATAKPKLAYSMWARKGSKEAFADANNIITANLPKSKAPGTRTSAGMQMLNHRAQHYSNFLTKPGFSYRATGAAIQHAKRTMMANVAFYGIERSFNKDQEGVKHPKWSNVPAVAVDMAKYTAAFTAIDAVFNLIKPGSAIAARGIVKAIEGAPSALKRAVTSAVSSLDNIVGTVSGLTIHADYELKRIGGQVSDMGKAAFSASREDTMNTIASMGKEFGGKIGRSRPGLFKRVQSMVGKSVELFNLGKRDLSSRLNVNRRRIEQALSPIEEHVNLFRDRSTFANSSDEVEALRASIATQLKQYEQPHKGGFVDAVADGLGLSQATLLTKGDVALAAGTRGEANELISRIEQVQKGLMEITGNKTIAYADGVYRTAEDKLVDLTLYRPGRVLGKMLGGASKMAREQGGLMGLGGRIISGMFHFDAASQYLLRETKMARARGLGEHRAYMASGKMITEFHGAAPFETTKLSNSDFFIDRLYEPGLAELMSRQRLLTNYEGVGDGIGRVRKLLYEKLHIRLGPMEDFPGSRPSIFDKVSMMTSKLMNKGQYHLFKTDFDVAAINEARKVDDVLSRLTRKEYLAYGMDEDAFRMLMKDPDANRKTLTRMMEQQITGDGSGVIAKRFNKDLPIRMVVLDTETNYGSDVLTSTISKATHGGQLTRAEKVAMQKEIAGGKMSEFGFLVADIDPNVPINSSAYAHTRKEGFLYSSKAGHEKRYRNAATATNPVMYEDALDKFVDLISSDAHNTVIAGQNVQYDLEWMLGMGRAIRKKGTLSTEGKTSLSFLEQEMDSFLRVDTLTLASNLGLDKGGARISLEKLGEKIGLSRLDIPEQMFGNGQGIDLLKGKYTREKFKAHSALTDAMMTYDAFHKLAPMVRAMGGLNSGAYSKVTKEASDSILLMSSGLSMLNPADVKGIRKKGLTYFVSRSGSSTFGNTIEGLGGIGPTTTTDYNRRLRMYASDLANNPDPFVAMSTKASGGYKAGQLLRPTYYNAEARTASKIAAEQTSSLNAIHSAGIDIRDRTALESFIMTESVERNARLSMNINADEFIRFLAKGETNADAMAVYNHMRTKFGSSSGAWYQSMNMSATRRMLASEEAAKGHANYTKVMQQQINTSRELYHLANMRDPLWNTNENMLTGIFPVETASQIIAKMTAGSQGTQPIYKVGLKEAAKLTLWEMTERFHAVGGLVGMGVDKARIQNIGDIVRLTAMRGLAIPAVAATAIGADQLIDANPIFDGTVLDEGVGVATAEAFVTADLLRAKTFDAMGVTRASQHLEGLMPGFTSSPASKLINGIGVPLAATSAGLLLGGPVGGGLGLMLGSAYSALTSKFGLDVVMGGDLTKGYEKLRDEYTGKDWIPVRKGRFWPLSRNSIEGGQVNYFRPNWFARLKSKYKETPVLYGGTMEGFLHDSPVTAPLRWTRLLDPYHYEKQHYDRRPYFQTSSEFLDIPFIGNLLESTIGQVVKPTLPMHQPEFGREMKLAQGGMAGVLPNTTFLNYKDVGGNYWMGNTGEMTDLMDTNALGVPGSRQDLSTVLSQTYYRGFVEPMGLVGYMTGGITGETLGPPRMTIQTAQEMTSKRRAFWDLQMGDPIGTTEYLRRFIPPERSEVLSFAGPRNTMADFLPGSDYYINFRRGDAYAKLPEGELTLPGPGYETATDVSHSFPVRASLMGKNTDDIVKYMLGLKSAMDVEGIDVTEQGTMIHKNVQDRWIQLGLAREAEQQVYDPYTDTSGHIDLIDMDGNPVEIKTTTTEKIAQMSRARTSHYDQINFYMRSTGKKTGKIVYVSRDDPSVTKTFDVGYSAGRMNKIIAKIENARMQANAALRDGYVPSSFGYSYSRVDRMRILANIAPYSKEYREERTAVEAQMRTNSLTDRDIEKYDDATKIQQTISRKFEFAPYRFKNILNPNSIDYQQLGLNEYALPADKYTVLERVVGSAWENFSHLDTPLHLKLLNKRSAREHYERTILMNREQARWTNPVSDFVIPMYRKARTDQGIANDIVSGATTGVMLGGGPIGAIAGAAGAVPLHALKKMGQVITGDRYVPHEMERKWEVDRDIKQLEYIRNMALYADTGLEEYKDRAMRSPVTYDLGKLSPNNIGTMKAIVTKQEQPFVEAFAQETDRGERDKIRSEVSPQMRLSLEKLWAMQDGNSGMEKFAAGSYTRYMKDGMMLPTADWSGWNPVMQEDDINLQIVKDEGLDAHDFGLGYARQQYRMNALPYKVQSPTYDGTKFNGRSEVHEQMEMNNNVLHRAISSLIKEVTGTMPEISIVDTKSSNINVSVSLR